MLHQTVVILVTLTTELYWSHVIRYFVTLITCCATLITCCVTCAPTCTNHIVLQWSHVVLHWICIELLRCVTFTLAQTSWSVRLSFVTCEGCCLVTEEVGVVLGGCGLGSTGGLTSVECLHFILHKQTTATHHYVSVDVYLSTLIPKFLHFIAGQGLPCRWQILYRHAGPRLQLVSLN